MCTIMTVDLDTYTTSRTTFMRRIQDNQQANDDGLSLVVVDPNRPALNTALSGMHTHLVFDVLAHATKRMSPRARFWLHQRAATTEYVGLPYNHGFTDNKGTIIHHNGILRNHDNMHVDSFQLQQYPTHSAYAVRNRLMDLQESFANIFLIRPNDHTYGVVRMMVGSLYTDGKGNYSTNPVADIDIPIDSGYAREYRMERTHEQI